MTANSKIPTCPACNTPYISENGDWQICPDCPFRNAERTSVDNDTSDPNSDEVGNLPVLVLVKLSDLIELRAQRDEAIRAQAEMLFRTINHEE